MTRFGTIRTLREQRFASDRNRPDVFPKMSKTSGADGREFRETICFGGARLENVVNEQNESDECSDVRVGYVKKRGNRLRKTLFRNRESTRKRR